MPASPCIVAYEPDCDFPIENLPLGIFERPDQAGKRVGTAIGNQVLDLACLWEMGALADLADVPPPDGSEFAAGSLNALMARGGALRRALRRRLQELLSPTGERSLAAGGGQAALVPLSRARLHLPVAIGDYTDFYASRDHATNVGTMFRGADQALMPNWLHLPVGYHGRASSIVLSGSPVRRPVGQVKGAQDPSPRLAPTAELDFELEVGAFIGVGNPLGSRIAAGMADDHVFGLVLVNDWSARDIQRWEYQPLGPFLAKNFATTISPWVVTLEALEAFRRPGPPQDEPEVLPYLRGARMAWFDLHLEVSLQSAAMRAQSANAETVISRSNLMHLYWSFAQQLAHHTVGGCNLRTGDLLASGTISGPGKGERGSMLELAWKGSDPLVLPTGERRSFLEDGDRLALSGWCQGDGFRVGFGRCEGEVLPALPFD